MLNIGIFSFEKSEKESCVTLTDLETLEIRNIAKIVTRSPLVNEMNKDTFVRVPIQSHSRFTHSPTSPFVAFVSKKEIGHLFWPKLSNVWVRSTKKERNKTISSTQSYYLLYLLFVTILEAGGWVREELSSSAKSWAGSKYSYINKDEAWLLVSVLPHSVSLRLIAALLTWILPANCNESCVQRLPAYCCTHYSNCPLEYMGPRLPKKENTFLLRPPSPERHKNMSSLSTSLWLYQTPSTRPLRI